MRSHFLIEAPGGEFPGKPAASEIGVRRSYFLPPGLVVAEHHQHALTWLRKLSDQRITDTDAMSFAVMARARCSVAMTFDSDFEMAGYERWRLS